MSERGELPLVADLATFAAITARLRAYTNTKISSDVCEQDVMFQRDVEHYSAVGRSAVRLIASTMIAANRSAFDSILDLPCGGGRVTRHLAALFPDARLYAAELNPNLRDFTCRAFGAEPIDTPADFRSRPSR